MDNPDAKRDLVPTFPALGAKTSIIGADERPSRNDEESQSGALE